MGRGEGFRGAGNHGIHLQHILFWCAGVVVCQKQPRSVDGHREAILCLSINLRGHELPVAFEGGVGAGHETPHPQRGMWSGAEHAAPDPFAASVSSYEHVDQAARSWRQGAEACACASGRHCYTPRGP